MPLGVTSQALTTAGPLSRGGGHGADFFGKGGVHEVGTVVFTVSALRSGVPVVDIWSLRRGITSVASQIVTIARKSCMCKRVRLGTLLQNSATARVDSLWMSVRAWCFACSAAVFGDRRRIGLRNSGGRRHRPWSSNILGELSQVLGGGNEQDLVAGAAQIAGRKRIDYPEDVSLHRRERRSGVFDRTLVVPMQIDADGIKAEYK
jgi:hypothetical protein